MVVMLQLHDIQIRQAQTLNILFYHPKPEVRQTVVSQVEKEDGSGVLLIFEGCNELSSSQLYIGRQHFPTTSEEKGDLCSCYHGYQSTASNKQTP